jgi:hypothetical protein
MAEDSGTVGAPQLRDVGDPGRAGRPELRLAKEHTGEDMRLFYMAMSRARWQVVADWASAGLAAEDTFGGFQPRSPEKPFRCATR